MDTKIFLAFTTVFVSCAAFGQPGKGADIECETFACTGQTGPTILPLGTITMTNSGSNGAALNGPGFGTAAGNICANVYTFSPDEQLVSCCSCIITPNGLASLSIDGDLISNTLTGIRPSSLTVTLIPTLAGPTGSGTNCTNSAALAGTANFPIFRNSSVPAGDSGLLAWGTKLLKTPVASNFAASEVPFLRSYTSEQQLASLTGRCTNIIGNGSTFGICRSCRVGGLAPLGH